MQTKEQQELKGEGQEKKEPQTIQKQEQMETISTIEVEQSKM